jgi:hypothetical protein
MQRSTYWGTRSYDANKEITLANGRGLGGAIIFLQYADKYCKIDIFTTFNARLQPSAKSPSTLPAVAAAAPLPAR